MKVAKLVAAISFDSAVSWKCHPAVHINAYRPKLTRFNLGLRIWFVQFRTLHLGPTVDGGVWSERLWENLLPKLFTSIKEQTHKLLGMSVS